MRKINRLQMLISWNNKNIISTFINEHGLWLALIIGPCEYRSQLGLGTSLVYNVLSHARSPLWLCKSYCLSDIDDNLLPARQDRAIILPASQNMNHYLPTGRSFNKQTSSISIAFSGILSYCKCTLYVKCPNYVPLNYKCALQ